MLLQNRKEQLDKTDQISPSANLILIYCTGHPDQGGFGTFFGYGIPNKVEPVYVLIGNYPTSRVVPISDKMFLRSFLHLILVHLGNSN